jgi:hypothetical protein
VSGRDDRLLAPTRWTAAAIVPVLLAAAVILYLFPSRTEELWAWTVSPTMTAMTMGGGYLAGAWFFYRVVTTGRWHPVAAGFLGTTVFTTLLLLATLLHWDRFNHDHVSFWAWLALYVATPVLLPWLWARNRATDPGVADAGRVVPRPLRWAVGAAGAAQLAFAAFMFVRPTVVAEHWPWALTPLTARTLSAFVAFPAVTWVWFLFDERWSSFRIPLETATLGIGLVAVAAVRARDELDGSHPQLWLYLAALVVTLAWVVALQVAERRAAAPGVVSP